MYCMPLRSPFKRIPASLAVQMAICHMLCAVLFKQLRKPGRLPALIKRRIVHHAKQKFVLRRTGKRKPHADDLAVINWAVRGLIEPNAARARPSARPRDGNVAKNERIVLQRVHPFRQSPAHLCKRVPPIIVVAAQNQLFPREGRNRVKIRFSLPQGASPN